jgi:hypothetical protein
LRPAAPGWKSVVLAPPRDVQSDYHYSLQTPAGLIEVEYANGRAAARWPAKVPLQFGRKQMRGSGKMVTLDTGPRH